MEVSTAPTSSGSCDGLTTVYFLSTNLLGEYHHSTVRETGVTFTYWRG